MELSEGALSRAFIGKDMPHLGQSKQNRFTKRGLVARISGHITGLARETAPLGIASDRLPRIFCNRDPAQRLLQPQSKHVLLV